jgi:hypothetical protein
VVLSGLPGYFERLMNPKKRPNHKRYIEVLRAMTPEQRLLKAFELSAFSKALFIHGLRKQFPNITEEEIRTILVDQLVKKSQNELRIHAGKFLSQSSSE